MGKAFNQWALARDAWKDLVNEGSMAAIVFVMEKILVKEE